MRLKKILAILIIISTSLILIVIGNIKNNAHRNPEKEFDLWVRLINSNDKFTQMGAIRALGKLGDKRAVKLILPLLNDENLWVKVETVRTIGKLGDKEMVEPLIDLLQTSVNPPVRREAALSLGLLGDIKGVDPLIMRLKNDNNPLVKLNIIKALGMIGDKKVYTIVKYYTNNKDIWIRTEAEKTLKKLNNLNQ